MCDNNNFEVMDKFIDDLDGLLYKYNINQCGMVCYIEENNKWLYKRRTNDNSKLVGELEQLKFLLLQEEHFDNIVAKSSEKK